MIRYFEYFLMFFLVLTINVLNIMTGISNSIYLVPIVAVYFFLKNGTSIAISKDLIPLFCILLWGSMTLTFSSYDITVALQTHRRFFFTLIYMTVIFWYSRQSLNHSRDVFNFYLFSFFIASFFVLSGNVDFYSTSRLEYTEEGAFNANYYGYLSFGGIIASIVRLNFNRSGINLAFIILTFALSLVMNILSASRAGFGLVVLLLIVYWLSSSLRFFNKNIFLITFSIVPILSLSIFALSYLDNLLSGTFLMSRFLEGYSDDLRFLHIFEGIRIFINNFIFGIGPGHYQLMNEVNTLNNSHNSFIEIGVSYGFLALFFYLYFLKSFLSKKVGDNNIILNRIFILGFMLYQFFYITYLSPFFMGLAINYLVFIGHNSEDNFINHKILK